MFQAAYQSAWQHPGIAWIAGALLLAIASRGRRDAWWWAFVVLEVEILLDAWLTGALAPAIVRDGVRGGGAEVAAIAFVILGDLRFFYLVERQRGAEAASARATLRALLPAIPVALVVPVATAVLRARWPQLRGNALYLVYEAGLLVLAIAYCAARAPRTRYVGRLLAVECAQYAGWVAADALIVFGAGAGRELGWLLRMVPNAIYYAAFVPVATWKPPPGSRV